MKTKRKKDPFMGQEKMQIVDSMFLYNVGIHLQN